MNITSKMIPESQRTNAANNGATLQYSLKDLIWRRVVRCDKSFPLMPTSHDATAQVN